MLEPKNPEVDEWKVVKAKVKGKKKNFKPAFDYLLSKYVNQKTESRDRSSKGSATPSLKQDRSHSHRSGYVSNMIKIGSVDVTINDQVDNKILDHGASNNSLASEYMHLRWCPPGLSHTQKRRLQQLQNQESKEKELKPLKEVNKKKEVPAGPLPSIKKGWRPKQLISASNYTRLEDMADILPSPLERIWSMFCHHP
jgi:hypothetical protein